MNKRYSHRFQILSLLWVKPVTSRPKKWGIAFPPFDEKSLRIDVFYINVILFFWKYNLLPFPCFLLVHAEPCSICHPQCDELVLVPSTGGALFILLHIFCQTPVSRGGDSGLSSRWWCSKVMISCSFCLFPHQYDVVSSSVSILMIMILFSSICFFPQSSLSPISNKQNHE